MKKVFAFFAVLAAMILMVSCGGSSEGDDHKICEEDLDLYFCWSSGAASSHYICKKGEEAKPFYNVFSDNPDDSNEILGYCSDNEYIECHSGCDKNTGKCIPECAKGQYKCDSESYIFSCNDYGQWTRTNERCENGCAKELSESILDMCSD